MSVLLSGILLVSPAAFAQSCTGLCLQQVSCPGGGTTSVSGVVYTPNGTDPLPNAVVFVPNVANAATSNTSLPAFAAGVQCVPSGAPVGGSPLVGYTTPANGSFTLTNMPVGTNIPLVIQAGRWRRKIIIPQVTACVNTVVTGVSFPTTQTAGDTDDNIPLIAVSTGSIDAAECVLRKVGIADSMFSDPGGSGRIQFYTGIHSAGSKIDAATPPETQLVGTVAGTSQLNNYDMVMFPCQGGITTAADTASWANIVSYANAGGRIFATHWSEAWIDTSATFPGTANWAATAVTIGSNIPATINLLQGTGTFTDGTTIAQWLQDIGSTTTYGQIPDLNSTFENVSSVIAPTQTWITLNDTTYGNPIMQFTFNTPVGGTSATQCGRILYNDYHVETPATESAVFPKECNTSAMTPQEKILEYSLFDLSTFITPAGPPTITLGVSNSPTNFTDGDTADTITLNVTNTSTVNPSNPSLTVTVTLPTGLTATAMQDATGTGGWLCTAATLTCTRINGLDANTSAPITLTVSVAPTTLPPTATVSATVSGGGLTTNVTGTDTIKIIGVPIITWGNQAPIINGTALSGTQLDATANVPGTFVYTPPAGTVMLTPGTQTLSSVFTATDTVNYPNPVTTNVTISVTQIPQNITFTTLTSPVTYGVAPIPMFASGGASGNPVTFSVVSGPATVSGTNGSTLNITGAGTVVVAANQAGNVTYAAATQVTQTIIVNPATLTVTAASPTIIYGSTLPTYTAAITGYVNGDTSAVVSGTPSLTTTPATPSNVGTYPITAAPGTLAAANYSFVFTNGTLTITQAAQTITFTLASPVTYGVTPITLNATSSSSGNPITFTATGPATLSGNILTITGAGTVTVTANQAGNSNYIAAAAVLQTLVVNKATLTVTAASPTIPYGSALPTYTATITGYVNSDTSAVVSGAPSLTTTPATPSAAGTYPITATLGTLAAANYNFVFVNGTLTITQAVQTISFTLASPFTYGVAPITLSATGGASGNPVTFSLISGPAILAGSTLTITGAGTVVITASQAGNTNYAAATPVTQTLIVNPAAQTITFTLASPVTYGVAPITLSATGGASGNPVTFSATGPATVSGNILTITGGGTVLVTANQAGNANYAAATAVTDTLVVKPEAQTINFTAPATPVTFGVPPVTLTATASSGLPVIFSVLSGSATVSGNTLTITGGGSIVVAADQPGNANYAAAAEVAYTIVVAKDATATILSTTPTTLFIQNPVVLSASVTSTYAIPTGTVTFMDGSTALGTATVNSSGIAALTTSYTTTGTHTITAVYSGSAGYSGSSGAPVTDTLMDFSLIATGVVAQDVEHGTTATYTFSVSPIGGATMPEDITFALDGVPQQFVVAFTPQPVASGSGISTVTLTLQTPDYPTPTQSGANQTHSTRTLAFIALGALLLPFGRRFRRKPLRLLACALLLLAGAGALTGVSGCGTGWQHEDFTLTVSASSGSLAHYAVTTLRVH